MLELRPTCEHCNKALPPDALEARICLKNGHTRERNRLYPSYVWRVVAFVREENPASIRVAEKLGMTVEGSVHREGVNMSGRGYAVSAQDVRHDA